MIDGSGEHQVGEYEYLQNRHTVGSLTCDERLKASSKITITGTTEKHFLLSTLLQMMACALLIVSTYIVSSPVYSIETS